MLWYILYLGKVWLHFMTRSMSLQVFFTRILLVLGHCNEQRRNSNQNTMSRQQNTCVLASAGPGWELVFPPWLAPASSRPSPLLASATGLCKQVRCQQVMGCLEAQFWLSQEGMWLQAYIATRSYRYGKTWFTQKPVLLTRHCCYSNMRVLAVESHDIF